MLSVFPPASSLACSCFANSKSSSRLMTSAPSGGPLRFEPDRELEAREMGTLAPLLTLGEVGGEATGEPASVPEPEGTRNLERDRAAEPKLSGL